MHTVVVVKLASADVTYKIGTFAGVLTLGGAFVFGIVVGWITYRTLRQTAGRTSLSDIATVIAAVGGAAVTGLFPQPSGAFGAYCIGLGLGFFGYLIYTRDPRVPVWTAPRTNPQ